MKNIEFRASPVNSCCICRKLIGREYFCLSGNDDNNNMYCENCIGALSFGKELNELSKKK